MLKQIYNEKELGKEISKYDVWKKNLWSDEQGQKTFLEKATSRINEKDYAISPLIKAMINGKTVYQLANNIDWLALKKVNFFLRRIYKITPFNRQTIVKQLKAILKDQSAQTILKLDIKGFYESVAFERLSEKIRNDMILGLKGIKILESLFEQTKAAGLLPGIPRGICISATLAELACRELDKKIKNQPGVFYYMRYVDDLIVVLDDSGAGNKSSETLKKKIEDLVLGCGFKINDKFFFGKIANQTLDNLDYLGYSFARESAVEVDVSPEKVNKIKKKIARCFVQYLKDGNYKALRDRLRFLSTNVVVSKTANGLLYGGNCYNYVEVTRPKSFAKIDFFVHQILNGKSRLGKAVKEKIDATHINSDDLKKFSFSFGFDGKLKTKFSKRRSKSIRKAFAYA